MTPAAADRSAVTSILTRVAIGLSIIGAIWFAQHATAEPDPEYPTRDVPAKYHSTEWEVMEGAAAITCGYMGVQGAPTRQYEPASEEWKACIKDQTEIAWEEEYGDQG